jgi:hypothetical protein
MSVNSAATAGGVQSMPPFQGNSLPPFSVAPDRSNL